MLKFMKHILKSTNLKDRIRIFMMLTICVSFLFFSFATTYIYKNLFYENTSQLMLKNFNLTYSNLEKIIEIQKLHNSENAYVGFLGDLINVSYCRTGQPRQKI